MGPRGIAYTVQSPKGEEDLAEEDLADLREAVTIRREIREIKAFR